MYKKILACIDGSFNAEAAAQYALDLAQACTAECQLVSVLEKENERTKQILASFQRLVHRAKQKHINIHTHFLYGKPISQIQNLVKKENIDLVVASSRRADWEKRFFIRSVPQKLMLYLPCSVIMVRVVSYRGGRAKKILVPLRDWRYYFKERLYFLSRFATTFATKLVIFHIKAISNNKSKFLTREEITKLKQIGKQTIHPFTDALKELGIKTESKVEVSANLAQAIIAEAARGRYDFIFMGAYQRDVISRAVEGNLVEEVLRNTLCDIMVWYPQSRRLQKSWWQKIVKAFRK
ncbi:MAG: universal stress protein [Candidatus Desulfofervidaceae bacterium]|nr:universal stress protein [Candidatus Desulfofervidaceae bacterium]